MCTASVMSNTVVVVVFVVVAVVNSNTHMHTHKSSIYKLSIYIYTPLRASGTCHMR